ncbi:hypothetical protein N7E02_08020 [Aliirhizobium terrae]|uniref:hypothetical protein n=1 Tax=Terrirhizobium terrae TaxID=2926709 RepID=UPI0025782656|nr:hypothetical protein [Rhizobium sp. CC-CFT758]WJH40554.1 hypothetical protein N7E02_08020 [Rhizobium sp. CC-CFT758]
MNDNVIKFQRPKQPKPPRQTPPWLKRLLTVLGIIIVLVAVWAYFQFIGSAP